MSQFHNLTVRSIRQLTHDSVEIGFEIPDHLTEHYVYEQGQFVLLRTNIEDDVIERAYSICRAPYERKLNVAVKRVENGLFSTYATNVLAEGDSLEVAQPSGTFTCQLDSSQANDYLFVAAGSGITPIISIIKMILASEPMSKCILLFGNKSVVDIMFLEDIVALKERYSDQLQVEWVLSQEQIKRKKPQSNLSKTGAVYNGKINSSLLKKVITKESYSSLTTVFLCGPELMTLSLREYLIAQGVSSDNIKIELFSTAGITNISSFEENELSNAEISLLIDGEELTVMYEDATESILEHALRVDPDLPYGCQNGSCGTCQAKVISGDVSMHTNYALSENEVKQGYVLLCQAHPKSIKVSISYDE